MIFVSKEILLPLKGIILRVTSSKVPRYEVIVIISSLSWNHAPSYLDVELLLTNEPPSSTSSIAPGVCFVYQLKRCSYVSLRELILSVRSSRRSFSVESPSVVVVLDEVLESKDVKIHLNQWINIFEKGKRIMKIVVVLWPPILLPHVLNLGTRFLFSGGELSHPQIRPCLSLL